MPNRTAHMNKIGGEYIREREQTNERTNEQMNERSTYALWSTHTGASHTFDSTPLCHGLLLLVTIHVPLARITRSTNAGGGGGDGDGRSSSGNSVCMCIYTP